MLKPVKALQKLDDYRLIFLINIDEKIINEILVNPSQEYTQWKIYWAK